MAHKIAELIGIYFQTSRKYRAVTRFPVGLSPKEALYQAARPRWTAGPIDFDRWLAGLTVASAGDHYLRVYAPEEATIELSPDEFKQYRSLGGDVFR